MSCTIRIKYQIPAMTSEGALLDEARFDFSDAALEINMGMEGAGTLQRQTTERIASATRVLARELRIKRTALGIRLHDPHPYRPFSFTHASTTGHAVIEMTLSTSWGQTLAFEMFRLGDILEGRFPSLHPAVQVPWLDLLWSLSLAGRMERRVPTRPTDAEMRVRIQTTPTDGDIRKNRSELITALRWKAKQEGLSLTRMDGETIAHRLWATTPTLKEVVELGSRYGLRLRGPLASVPLTETWRPRRKALAAERT